MTRLRTFFRHQRRAWSALFGRRAPVDQPTLCPPPDSQHPSSLCQCFSRAPASPEHVIHRPDCPWLAAMCRLCLGAGHCQRCGGDGTEPSGPAVDLFEDGDVLRRAVRRLEDWGMGGRPDVLKEARALRTLLERLDGAP